MVAKKHILKNITELEKLYNNSTDPKISLYYSKLTLLELCGWIEESMDDIIFRCSKRKLKILPNQKYVQDRIIKNTYGFEYDRYFRSMLIKLVGLINVERIEKSLDATVFSSFTSTLSLLKNSRDKQAHTHLQGITIVIDAPSVTKNNLLKVYEGLKKYDSELKRFGL